MDVVITEGKVRQRSRAPQDALHVVGVAPTYAALIFNCVGLIIAGSIL
jgi:hypothetical protein